VLMNDVLYYELYIKCCSFFFMDPMYGACFALILDMMKATSVNNSASKELSTSARYHCFID